MCGISAAVSLETDTKSSRPHTFQAGFSKKLEESLHTIRHRGPDAQGQWTSSDDRVGKYTYLHDNGGELILITP